MAKVFDIQGDLNPGKWYTWEEDEEPQDGKLTRVKVRTGNAGFLAELYAKTRRKAVEHKVIQGQLHRIDYEEVKNPEQEKQALWNYGIVDWENLLDSEGNEIPCTKENKILLMKGSPEFVRFIAECQEKLRSEEKEAEETEEKN